MCCTMSSGAQAAGMACRISWIACVPPVDAPMKITCGVSVGAFFAPFRAGADGTRGAGASLASTRALAAARIL